MMVRGRRPPRSVVGGMVAAAAAAAGGLALAGRFGPGTVLLLLLLLRRVLCRVGGRGSIEQAQPLLRLVRLGAQWCLLRFRLGRVLQQVLLRMRRRRGLAEELLQPRSGGGGLPLLLLRLRHGLKRRLWVIEIQQLRRVELQRQRDQ